MSNSPTPFQLFSPFLKQHPSPMLSPFPHLRKISDDFNDLITFRLEPEPQSLHILECETPQLNQHNTLLSDDYQLALGSNELPQDSISADPSSPIPSQRCQMPSTKFHQPKDEPHPPYLLLSEDSEVSIQSMIEFLVEHSQLRDDLLNFQGKRFAQLGPNAQETFKILAGKFKRLRKTKEELTKYCMRKAFKYVSERGKGGASGRGLEGSMKRYFAEEEDTSAFSVPFKKNSAEKTMNGNFLRRVFGCPRFAADYKNFLYEFSNVIKEDNSKKVAYLANLVENALKANSISKVQSIKRLPWTAQILNQTKELAASLPEQAYGRRSKRVD